MGIQGKRIWMRQRRRLFPGSFSLPFSEQHANKPTGERKQNTMKPHKLILIPLLIVCFGLAPVAQAVNPPPDGGYPGFNTAEGTNALFNLNIAGGGVYNTALGGLALFSDTIGAANTAVGLNALRFNTEGDSNTAVGVNALIFNTTSIQNVAVGQGALASNNGASSNANVAVGYQALGRNNSGIRNVAIGYQALFNNTTAGNASNAVGYRALFNSNGLFNNAFGWLALGSVTSGGNNVAVGDDAGHTLTTGSGNVYIGAGQGASAAGENNTTRIRNIGTTPLNTGMFVEVDANGKLGFITSSRRYKHDIEPMGNASEALYALKPVTFRYNGDIDPAHVKMFGLIAEDVAQVYPDLAVRNAKGEVIAIRFDSINAMLLNEFLKEHERVEELQATVAQQQKGMEVLTAQLKEQAAQIQKVSAQVELNKRAPQTIAHK
jgi:hypothetical protein